MSSESKTPKKYSRLSIKDIRDIASMVYRDINNCGENWVNEIAKKYNASRTDIYRIVIVVKDSQNGRLPELYEMMVNGTITPSRGYNLHIKFIKMCASIGIPKSEIDDHLDDPRLVSWKKRLSNITGRLSCNDVVIENEEESTSDTLDEKLEELEKEFGSVSKCCVPKKTCKCECGHNWIEDRYFIPKFCPNCGRDYRPIVDLED